MTDTRLIWILFIALVFVLFMDDGAAQRWCDTYVLRRSACNKSYEIMTADDLRKQQDVEHAMTLGAAAYNYGWEWSKNPYPVDTDEHKVWIDGWRMERDYWGSK